MSRIHFLGLWHHLLLAILLVSTLTLLIPVSVVRADTVVTFPDPNLQAAIRAAIGKPSGDIYQSDLSSLTLLSANSKGIVDLTGLQYCTSLTYLDLYGNQITDISPLSGLTSLENVWISKNQVSDISPLSGLTNLTTLDLNSNHITDISPLSSLTSLVSLGLGNNQISNISPLGSLTKLQWLHLEYNYSITDITPLSGLTNLTELEFHANHVSNISLISGLTNLHVLTILDSQLSDISPLASLNKLTSLFLEGNQISNISPLASLTSLTGLSLVSDHISDLSTLSSMTKLTSLFLDGNQMSHISPLASLTSLHTLSILDSQVSDISPLASLTALTFLGISLTQVSDISPLSGLTALTYLDLSNNQISNVSPLSSLSNLQFLFLRSNQIGDIEPLVSNTGLGTGDYVYLTSNPLNPTSIYDYVSQLRARGVTVEWQWGPPTISLVSPSSGIQGQTLSGTVTGTYLTGASAVSFGSGVTVNSFNVDSSTQITANVTIDGAAAVGSKDVSVTTPGGTATKTSSFSVVATASPPTITSVSPSEGSQGKNLAVNITGTNFTAATAVSFGSGITVNNFSVNSDSQMTASISIGSSASIGTRDVSVTAPSGLVTKTGGFTVTQKGESTDETPNNTETGGGGLPLWVWIIVGVAAALVVGVGAYLIGRRRQAYVAVQVKEASITPASGDTPKQEPPQAKCPFCASTTFRVEEEAGYRRCSDCHSVLPSYMRGNR